MDAFRDAVKERFPTTRDLRVVNPHISITDDAVKTTTGPSSRIGIRLESEDKKLVVQATGNSLLVSRLTPYESWELLITQVRTLWLVHCDVFGSPDVTRLGVRYINRIALPEAGPIDLDTILTAGPRIPAELPQRLQQYLSRCVLRLDDDGATLALAHSHDSPGQLTLDLDAFAEMRLKASDPGIWEKLEVLRRIKNDAFFSSLHRSVWEAYL